MIYVANENDNGKTYQLAVLTNDRVRIELEEGGFAGWYWEVVSEPDAAVIRFSDQGTTYNGSLGTHVWTCDAIGQGTTGVELKRSDGLVYTLTFQVI